MESLVQRCEGVAHSRWDSTHNFTSNSADRFIAAVGWGSPNSASYRTGDWPYKTRCRLNSCGMAAKPSRGKMRFHHCASCYHNPQSPQCTYGGQVQTVPSLPLQPSRGSAEEAAAAGWCGCGHGVLGGSGSRSFHHYLLTISGHRQKD